MSADKRIEAFLREQIVDLAGGRNEWAGMVDLRPRLGQRGLSRAVQDEHLKRLSREGKLSLAPESNRKALRPEDHDAAIRIGHDDSHLVAWLGD